MIRDLQEREVLLVDKEVCLGEEREAEVACKVKVHTLAILRSPCRVAHVEALLQIDLCS